MTTLREPAGLDIDWTAEINDNATTIENGTHSGRSIAIGAIGTTHRFFQPRANASVTDADLTFKRMLLTAQPRTFTGTKYKTFHQRSGRGIRPN